MSVPLSPDQCIHSLVISINYANIGKVEPAFQVPVHGSIRGNKIFSLKLGIEKCSMDEKMIPWQRKRK